jgi:hypothetical protein
MDRHTMLAASAIGPLRAHLAAMKVQHDNDLARGTGFVALPDAWRAKDPAAGPCCRSCRRRITVVMQRLWRSLIHD